LTNSENTATVTKWRRASRRHPFSGSSWLGGASRLRRGEDRAVAARVLARRGLQIFLVAHLMRLPSVFNPAAGWTDIFTPDILNVLGLGMIAGAFAWARARTFLEQIVWLVVPALVITLIVAPAIDRAHWPASLPPHLEAYLRPRDGYGVFSLLPWIAFVLAGVWAGARLSTGRSTTLLALGAAGVALFAAGMIGRQLPPLLPTTFWTTSLSWMLIRTGVLLAALPIAAGICRAIGSLATAPGVVLGQTSLFVYVAHLALTYGWSTSPMSRALDFRGALWGAALLTLLMTVLATAWRAARSGRIRAGVQSPARSRP
jgi:hypothetical protein